LPDLRFNYIHFKKEPAIARFEVQLYPLQTGPAKYQTCSPPEKEPAEKRCNYYAGYWPVDTSRALKEFKS
jgi:hypothetical protein